jgi:hypothetical protein
MATVAASAETAIPLGSNRENWELIQATVGAASSSDTVTIQLPARWVGTGFTIMSVRLEQFTTAASGSRTRSNLAITSYSYVETTGVLSMVIGAAVTTNGRAYVLIAPAS